MLPAGKSSVLAGGPFIVSLPAGGPAVGAFVFFLRYDIVCSLIPAINVRLCCYYVSQTDKEIGGYKVLCFIYFTSTSDASASVGCG